MNLRSSVLSLLSLLACGSIAVAQGPDGPPPPPGGIFIHPTMPASMQLITLLKRVDVQTALALSVDELKALDPIINGGQAGRVRVSITAEHPLSEEERQREVDRQIAAQFGSTEEKIKAILTPDQFKRLGELALQWKGLLTLADARVADRLKISAPHRGEIGRIAAEYDAVKSQVMQSLMQQNTDASPDGSRRAVMVRLDTSKLEDTHSDAYMKLDAAKKAAERKITAVLSEDEKAAWKDAIGTPMAFRPYLKGNRF